MSATTREEFQAVLERVLTEATRDPHLVSLLRAIELRLRLAFPDVGLTLDVAATAGGEHGIEWRFEPEADWRPRLELVMDSEIANRYLQGAESIAVAIARGRVRCRGDSRVALRYLPALREVCEAYRRVVTQEYPKLALV